MDQFLTAVTTDVDLYWTKIFKAEGLGVALFECIESEDPTALIGLPLIWLAGALRGAGYRLP